MDSKLFHARIATIAAKLQVLRVLAPLPVPLLLVPGQLPLAMLIYQSSTETYAVD